MAYTIGDKQHTNAVEFFLTLRGIQKVVNACNRLKSMLDRLYGGIDLRENLFYQKGVVMHEWLLVLYVF